LKAKYIKFNHSKPVCNDAESVIPQAKLNYFMGNVKIWNYFISTLQNSLLLELNKWQTEKNEFIKKIITYFDILIQLILKCEM
jgi:hypothetical protein